MIQAPATTTPSTVFTATLGGMYALYVRHVSGNQFRVVKSSVLLTQVTAGQERSGLFYLLPSDTLDVESDTGSATADVAVAWVGDGLV